ncbi:polysulfide reductase NrfD [Saccharopolyspora erythraea NRRL 2338]|uniref:NrfD/PsrC family molybdoenzyme membrane anchor subunit n=1 Tax=Saccharopolyspora erythraea TaxID=1836 RepID=UPI0001D30ED9|nr:NrfD/PsrC family molybdoenzyme membrane anchor subunit [Saccharopolyspora erythraea]EQD81391.1 polysulfide reductase [Saccharopolyspora erythraea D]PFG96559.1 polysulfide reductase NrfD [Saccharopolyspora erythraea NRRL 2338]
MTEVDTGTDFRSYYGKPVLKEPVWKVPDVPAYLYMGGLAGSSSTMALLADLTGRPELARNGRIAAAAGAAASVVALVHDLGRPTRFLNMLRVFKPTSPLSVGSWILAPFSALAGAAAASDLTGYLPALGRLSAGAAGVIAPAMTTYTAVLLADTAVPAWHEMYRELPFVFAGSAVASAGGMGMITTPVAQAGPARRMAVAGSALELAATERIHRREGIVGEVYEKGRAGKVLRMAKALTVAGAATALFAGRSRTLAVASGLCLTAAGVATRYGIFDAGRVSARDPRYTIVPQRERKSAEERLGVSS